MSRAERGKRQNTIAKGQTNRTKVPNFQIQKTMLQKSIFSLFVCDLAFGVWNFSSRA